MSHSPSGRVSVAVSVVTPSAESLPKEPVKLDGCGEPNYVKFCKKVLQCVEDVEDASPESSRPQWEYCKAVFKWLCSLKKHNQWQHELFEVLQDCLTPYLGTDGDDTIDGAAWVKATGAHRDQGGESESYRLDD